MFSISNYVIGNPVPRSECIVKIDNLQQTTCRSVHLVRRAKRESVTVLFDPLSNSIIFRFMASGNFAAADRSARELCGPGGKVVSGMACVP